MARPPSGDGGYVARLATVPVRSNSCSIDAMQHPNLLSSCLTSHQLECYAQGTLHGQTALACEEHLLACTACQSVLAELFESGKKPDWLAAKASKHATRSSNADDSTQRSTDQPKPFTESGSQQPVAHVLWQQAGAASPADGVCAELLPEAIGRYTIHSALGSGGFGQVYLARDQKLQRNVALKVPHHSQTQHPVHWNLLLAEAQTVAALDHPSIVPIYDVAATDEVPMFLVSKLIEGPTLSAELSRRRIPAIEAARLIMCVADALQYAHERGVIHRDIKPQNILLDPAGQVYLADFGLAWRVADDARTFPDAGTPFYMSPEQLSGSSQHIDARSDVYSLARVLQQMLGGFAYLPEHSPENSGAAKALIQASSVSASSAALSQPIARLPDSVPGELRAICTKATAMVPAQRYQSAAEFSRALRSFIDSQTPFFVRHRRSIIAIGSAFTLCLVVLALSLVGVSRAAARHSAERAVEALLQADPGALAHRALSDELVSPWAIPLLQAAAAGDDPHKRARARLGLMRSKPALAPLVAEDLLDAPADIGGALITHLIPHAPQLCPAMWKTLRDDSSRTRRLNAAAFLASAAPEDERWCDDQLVDRLLIDLVNTSMSDRKHLISALLAKRDVILAALRRAHGTRSFHIDPEERLGFNNLWETLVENDTRGSIELMLLSPPHTFTNILKRLDKDDPETIRLLQEKVRQVPSSQPGLLSSSFQQRHLAAMALLKLGHEEDYWPLWRSHSDPSHLTVQLSVVGYDPITWDCIVARLRQTGGLSPQISLPSDLGQRLFRADLAERRNLLLALTAGQFKAIVEKDSALLDELRLLYRREADPCVHGLARQLLSTARASLPELDAVTRSPDQNGSWYVNSLDEVLIIVPPSPAMSYRLAVSSRELQRQHFEMFLKETQHDWSGVLLAQESDLSSSDPTAAQAHMSWYDAAAFCNWLSRREGLEECYAPNSEGKYAAGMSIRANVYQLSGYRMPDSVEWENVGRAGVHTRLYFGNTLFSMRDYLWDLSNSRGATKPVGQLRPNYLGLFDVHGNVSEWTMPLTSQSDSAIEIRNDQQMEHHGGNVISARVAEAFFGNPGLLTPEDRSRPTGLRIVRTLK